MLGSAPAAWQAAMGFSQRLGILMKITAAYQRSQPALSALEARDRASILDAELFNKAESAEDYERKCEGAIAKMDQEAPSEANPEDVGSQPSQSPVGMNIGKYKHAQYHREGLFSVIYKAPIPDRPENSSHKAEFVALKLTTPSMMEPPHDSRREARILELSRSTNVIPLLETFREAGTRFVIVLPFMSSDLDQALQDNLLSKIQIKNCLNGLFHALEFIHARGVIHRDVKPSNILLKSLDGPAYLSDFGIAWSPDAQGSETPENKITDVGTTCYRPPELLFGNKKYGCSLDLWAAGCTVAEAVVQGHPTLFEAGDLGSELALIQSIFKKLGTPNLSVWPEAAHLPDWGKVQFYEYPTQSWTTILPGASDTECNLVSELVKYESRDRMTAAQVLRHAYFTE